MNTAHKTPCKTGCDYIEFYNEHGDLATRQCWVCGQIHSTIQAEYWLTPLAWDWQDNPHALFAKTCPHEHTQELVIRLHDPEEYKTATLTYCTNCFEKMALEPIQGIAPEVNKP